MANRDYLTNEQKLDLMEQRTAALEKQVLGDNKDEGVKIADAIMGLQNKLQSLVTGREKITSIFAKLDELQKYLDPEFADNLALSEGAKLELIFAAEDKIRETIDSLQTVKDLEQYIDSEHIKATPSHIPKMQKLHKLHLELADGNGSLDSETKKFIDGYNSAIETLSEKFVLWDSILTELEAERDAAGGEK